MNWPTGRKHDINYFDVMASIFLKIVMALGIFCFLDLFHKHRRSLEIFGLSKAYDEIKKDIPEEEAKEFAISILVHAKRVLNYRIW